jgi:hypothetical protein
VAERLIGIRARCGALVLLVACGPAVSDAAEGGASASSSNGTTVATATSTSLPEGGVDPSNSSSGGDTTGEPADCETLAESCSSRCEIGKAYAAADWECIDSGSETTVCLNPGRQLATPYASAWWKQIDGVPMVVMTGHACPDQVAHEPLGWAECTGAVDEPSQCRCLCHKDECTGEDEAAIACDAPMVCPPATLFLKQGVSDAARCVFAALRDRVPGSYELDFPGPNDSTTFRLLVAADATVQVSRRMQWLTGCPSPLDGLWRPARTCTLAGTELFAGCADADVPPAACSPDPFTLAGWIDDCVDAPLTCD